MSTGVGNKSLDAADAQAIWLAKYIAMTVRNTMEDFHAKYLSDEQMKELNPLIRNGVYTALYAFFHAQDKVGANNFMRFQANMVPSYWEEPELTDDYKRSEEYAAAHRKEDTEAVRPAKVKRKRAK